RDGVGVWTVLRHIVSGSDLVRLDLPIHRVSRACLSPGGTLDRWRCHGEETPGCATMERGEDLPSDSQARHLSDLIRLHCPHFSELLCFHSTIVCLDAGGSHETRLRVLHGDFSDWLSVFCVRLVPRTILRDSLSLRQAAIGSD